MHKPAKMLHQR